MSVSKYATPGEKAVATTLVKAILANGMDLSVYDGEETTVARSTDADEVLEALCTADADSLIGRNIGETGIKVVFFLVWGNELSGECLIADHSDTQFATDLASLALEAAL